MSTIYKKIDNTNQLSLYDAVLKDKENETFKEGELDISEEYKQLASRVISSSKLSRYQICAYTSQLLKSELTYNMLNAYTAPSHENNKMPAVILPALCKVIKNYDLIDFLARKVERYVLPGPDALRSEIQKIDEEMAKLQEEKEKRLYFLKEIQGNGKK